jgi:stage V sporulation protein K
MASKLIKSGLTTDKVPNQINVNLRQTVDSSPKIVPINKEEPVRELTVKEPPTTSKEPIKSHPAFTDFEEELNKLIGMEEVKALVYEIYALLCINRLRQSSGLVSGSQVYHMIFKGNPGTGKTTVARIVAKLFQRMGVLSKGHLIEVERADLVGEYIGHTAQKTRDLIKKALGGVLFIDEAYSLARGGEKDFGKEAIDTLVKHMEDEKNQFILILAGYPEEIDYFLMTNPGLPSRFPISITFPDYSLDQLMEIAELMIGQREYILSNHAGFKLRQIILQAKQGDAFSFSNARFIRNLLEKAIRRHAVRVMQMQQKGTVTKMDLMTILSEDIRE